MNTICVFFWKINWTYTWTFYLQINLSKKYKNNNNLLAKIIKKVNIKIAKAKNI